MNRNQSSPSIVEMQTPVMRNTNAQYLDTVLVSPDDEHFDENTNSLALPKHSDFKGPSSRAPLQRRTSHIKTSVPAPLNQPLPLKKFLSYGNQPAFGLTLPPYQPTRQTEDEDFEEDDLQDIFNPVPLVSQWSIPSIRLANQFEDDEESWSSRGSSLYLPDDGDLTFLTRSSSSSQLINTVVSPPIIVVEGPLEDVTQNNNHIPYDSTTVDAICRKSNNPYEWLRTVNAESDEIAEAASSKFLTMGTSQPPQREDLCGGSE